MKSTNGGFSSFLFPTMILKNEEIQNYVQECIFHLFKIEPQCGEPQQSTKVAEEFCSQLKSSTQVAQSRFGYVSVSSRLVCT